MIGRGLALLYAGGAYLLAMVNIAYIAGFLYAAVRHPISLGWMLIPWLTPHMTVGQLVFAVSVTAYVLAATPFEERDLTEELGDDYQNYRQRVPAFVPGAKPAAPSPGADVKHEQPLP